LQPPGSRWTRGSRLYSDPGDPRYLYELGPQGLAKIDAATWEVRWARHIPLPQFPGKNLSGLIPLLFHGYTEILAFRYLETDGGTPVIPDQVITAVSDDGRVLASCTIPPAAENPVLLPRAGVLLLTSRLGVTAYTTSTGARLWQAATDMLQISADTVYATTAQRGDHVVAYDAASGRPLWSRRLADGAAAAALTVLNGVVYVQQASIPQFAADSLMAIRARDGTLLWRRRMLAGCFDQQIIAVDADSVLLLSCSYPADTAQIIDTRRGRVLAAAQIGEHQPGRWRAWPTVVDGHSAVVMASDVVGTAAFIIAAAHYHATFGARTGLSFAAVAQNVAYFISPRSCPATGLKVTGVDIRDGRRLWSIRLPASICDSEDGAAPELVPYDNGFAIPTEGGHVLLYR
jgi:hypothetical protein